MCTQNGPCGVPKVATCDDMICFRYVQCILYMISYNPLHFGLSATNMNNQEHDLPPEPCSPHHPLITTLAHYQPWFRKIICNVLPLTLVNMGIIGNIMNKKYQSHFQASGCPPRISPEWANPRRSLCSPQERFGSWVQQWIKVTSVE